MKVLIQPTKENISHWIRQHVPEMDLFFVEDQDLDSLGEYLDGTLVIPRREFFNHASYNQIHFVNSYEYWRISEKAQYIIVAPSNWITTLTALKRRELLSIQVQMGKGLLFPLSYFPSESEVPEEHIVACQGKDFVVVRHNMWSKLPYKSKEQVMYEHARNWDDWNCYAVPNHAPAHIKKFANQFSIVSGSNCLGTVLFAITCQEWLLNEWVHPDTFRIGLKLANYVLIDDEIRDGDVIVWIDDNDRVQHATYYLGNQLFFNKDGQSFYNPRKIVDMNELKETWNKYNMKVYRRASHSSRNMPIRIES